MKIKITLIQATVPTQKYCVLIPGGPGLSSSTMRSLDALKESSHLLYLDFQGTNNTSYDKASTFDDLVKSISIEIKKILPRNSLLFIIGHSYGGFFATSIALELKSDGLFCLATPFSKKSLASAAENYQSKKTSQLIETEKNWLKEQSDESFKKWLSEYGEMYFLNPMGKNMLLRDNVSANFFISQRSEISHFEKILEKIERLKILKIFISGSQDGLLSTEELEKDAMKGGFQFYSIEAASHFLAFDQPEKVISLIASKIAR